MTSSIWNSGSRVVIHILPKPRVTPFGGFEIVCCEQESSQNRKVELGNVYGQSSLEDFICKILDAAIENKNADALAQESVRGLIDDAHKK